jgi:hypothetical protein
MPKIAIEEEKRELAILNKDIEKDFIYINFKRLTNNPKSHNVKPGNKYHLTWSLNLSSKTVSEETPECDKALVFNYEKKV